jgi:hypothetical protein
VVDEQGRPVDPADVELPTGYEPPEPPADPTTQPADPAEIAWLDRRIKHLPDEVRNALYSRLEEKRREGRVQYPLEALTVTGLALATAMVNGAEADARKVEGWKPLERPEEGAEGPGATEQPPDAEQGDGEQLRAQAAAAGNPDEGKIAEAAPAAGEPPPDAPESPPPPSATQSPPEEPSAPQTPEEPPVSATRLPDDHPAVVSATAAVSTMTSKALNASLRERGLATTGNEVVRHDRLIQSLAREAADERGASS